MTVFEDVLTGEKVETSIIDRGLTFSLLKQPIAPEWLEVRLRYTFQEWSEFSLMLQLTTTAQVKQLASLIQKCRYRVQEVEGYIYTRGVRVLLSFKAKTALLKRLQKQVLPELTAEQIWLLKDPKGKSIFLDLDDAYDFVKIEIEMQ